MQTPDTGMTVQNAEKELIARILAGETDLFHELIRPCERMVYFTVLAMLKDEAEAEDVTQEAMLKAFRALSSFHADSKFSTWLVAIALNESRRRLRNAGRLPTELLEEQSSGEAGDFTPAVLIDWREVPLEALERKEIRQALVEAVNQLPSIYREVFTLRDIEEMNVRETAQALEISANVVKVRLHRARMLLQKRLAPLLKAATQPVRKRFFWSAK
ncbi:MAG TPA: sigma-70 family RNA polymerase sigma factor [Candidatus Dormibacteraeota bacterium]|jgi:RNA polymerase sigma-70 factor (ECF subfamily)|nr:sigma-70 family RNA polymerase sigma factor [Candidatus Dormibacteraeota bacterium]